MPAAAPKPSGVAPKPKPEAPLPRQRSLTEAEAPPPPAKWKKALLRVAGAILIVVTIAAMYVFLLLGEPDEEAKLASSTPEDSITMPMSAIEAPGETNLQSIADAFGKPMLMLYGSGLKLQKARVYDTAFGGGYARRATLSYALKDGSIISVESIRPTSAAALLYSSGYKLESGQLYALGGVNAAMMRDSAYACVFGQSDEAVYALTCPLGHDDELNALIKQTALLPISQK